MFVFVVYIKLVDNVQEIYLKYEIWRLQKVFIKMFDVEVEIFVEQFEVVEKDEKVIKFVKSFKKKVVKVKNKMLLNYFYY